jgi:hypothetical protein
MYDNQNAPEVRHENNEERLAGSNCINVWTGGLGVRTQTIISVQNVVSFPIYTEKDEKYIIAFQKVTHT